jgi:hypothetical protein
MQPETLADILARSGFRRRAERRGPTVKFPVERGIQDDLSARAAVHSILKIRFRNSFPP